MFYVAISRAQHEARVYIHPKDTVAGERVDLKPAMTRYRECARHVWNTYSQSMPDGWHEFAPVEDALFSGLVLGSFEPGEGLYRKHPEGYFETIVVAPIEVPGRVPMQHVRVEQGNVRLRDEWRWRRAPACRPW